MSGENCEGVDCDENMTCPQCREKYWLEEME